MCLILFAYQVHPQYPLILAANRDEFYQRKTRPADWWPEAPSLLAGKDLEAGGTWMGVTRSGRFAAVTNVREPEITASVPHSRGLLTRRYLAETIDHNLFSSYLLQSKDQYRGYNLVYGDSNRLDYFSNRSDRPISLQPGIYGISNAQLNTPWPKVEAGKQLLKSLLSEPDLDTKKLLSILTSTEIFRDEQLPATGVSLDWERKLSAICITSLEYGTRSSTVLLIDRHENIVFHEQTLASDPIPEKLISFQLQQ